MTSIVGILPDNLAFSSVPALIPKLGLYVRINIDVSANIGPIQVALSIPGYESRIQIGDIQPDLIAKAKGQAHAKGSPIAGIVSRAVLSPFEVRQPGRIRALAIVDGEQIVCGGLNVELKGDTASVPSAS